MKSRFVDQAWGRSALETLVVGGLAAVLAYAAGAILQVWPEPTVRRQIRVVAGRLALAEKGELRATHSGVVRHVSGLLSVNRFVGRRLNGFLRGDSWEDDPVPC